MPLLINELLMRSDFDENPSTLLGKCLEFVSGFLYSICGVMRGRGDS